jgi:hypothetical protein
VDAECKSLISICFSKIAGAAIGSPQFLASKEESMVCALCRYGVTDSGEPKSYSEGLDTVTEDAVGFETGDLALRARR